MALLGAATSLATHQLDPVTAAEGLLLAGLGALVLLCVAALERPDPGGEIALPVPPTRSALGFGAGLVALILWAVPSGAARGAAMTALLLFLLLRSAFTRLAESPGRLPLVVIVPLCLGLQGLFRPELFLHRSISREVLLEVWGPAVACSLMAALALNLLARRHGARGALIAGGAVVALGGGWNLVGSGGLLALAAGGLAVGPREEAGSPPSPALRDVTGWGAWTPFALLLSAVAVSALRGSSRRALAYLALLLVVAMVSAGWRRLEARGGWTPPRWLPWLGIAGLGALALLPEIGGLTPAQEPRLALQLLGLGVILLPQAILAPRFRSLLSLALGVLAVRWLPGSGPAAAGLGPAVAFLAVELPEDRRGAPAQNLWLGAWLVICTLASGYPWLRVDALQSVAEAFPTTSGWGGWTLAALGLLLVALAGGWAGEEAPGGGLRAFAMESRPWGHLILGFLLLAGTLWGLEPADNPVLAKETVTLTRDRPRWKVETSPTVARRLAVVSNLAFAADLPRDQPVAVLRLRHPGGKTSLAHLRAGRDTAEWAARRSDVACKPGLVVPPAWQVAAAPDGPYFSQRYRSIHAIESEEPIVAVDIFRRRNLPPEVSLTLFRVELLP